MICTSRRITYKWGDIIRLVPISDVHADARDCDWRQFKKDVAKQAKIPQTYFVGLGDYLEGIPVTDKRYRPSAKRFSTKDEMIDCAMDWFTELMEPAKGRILGLGRGNHEDGFLKRHGVNMVRQLARNLETEDLGMSFLLRLQLEDHHGGRKRGIVVYGHHGWGGGSRTAGGNLTKFERTRSNIDADVFLFGHVHGSKQTDTFVRLGIGNSSDRLIQKRQILCICGTYLRTFSNTADPTYSEAKGYPPSEIGHAVICFKPNREGLEMWAEG
jgi:hypothetical protein